MKLKLEFDIQPFASKINYDDKLFLAGSCFSENIAGLFEKYKFGVISNTHGILYNPHSISVSLNDCIDKKVYTENDLFYANETWNSFNHHSRFSHINKSECLRLINQQIEVAHEHLKNCKQLFITFGSAFVYEHKELGTLVGNCHKLPQRNFAKILLSKESIVKEYQLLLKQLRVFNKNILVTFTVSPVRYIRDGITENNLSKAILIQAVHELIAYDQGCSYFPAYEIVNDELRDYRFFEEDLVHPNQLAIDYVWERLTEACFTPETTELINELDLIIKAAAHRPFNEQSEAHKKFKETYLKKCGGLRKKFPHLDLSTEEKYFTS